MLSCSDRDAWMSADWCGINQIREVYMPVLCTGGRENRFLPDFQKLNLVFPGFLPPRV
jgi:hypothetical protein